VEAARPALEHGSSRTGRGLRVRRLQLALWIAVVEVVLVLVGVVPLWPAVGVGALLVAFHLVVGRRLRLDWAREASSIGAMSQLYAALAPALLVALGLVVLAAMLALAAAATLVVVASRRR
jgi:uncharacterized membrane protein